MTIVTHEESPEVPAFSCCSAGIGRWFWAAWASEDEARAGEKPLESGFEKSADLAEKKAAERLGTEVKRLPTKWASALKRGGAPAAGATSPGPKEAGRDGKPRSRFGRPKPRAGEGDPEPRLAFLYSAIAREPPDSLGHVAVARHRIVKQGARKIHVECDPFDEDAWARRGEPDAGSPSIAPKPRTVSVDRFELRKEGRFHSGRTHGGLTFYASEQDGIRDVEAALTARHAWCAVLGVRFPCSGDDVKAAYRRLALASHPDIGGDPASFRSVERAYRQALAYFAQAEEP